LDACVSAPIALWLSLLLHVDPSSEPATEPASLPASDAAASGPALRDIEELSLEDLLLVSAGGARVTPLRESPGSVWVINEQTLNTYAASSLYSTLRSLPGIKVTERSLANPEASLRFMGSFPDVQTLVLVDGREVTSDAVGFYDRTMLNYPEIERVELVLGPTSTIYGSNAFSGVMSITRRAPPREGERLQLRTDGGFATGNSTTATPGTPRELAPYGQAFASYGVGWGSGGFLISAGGQYYPSFGYRTDSGDNLRIPGRRVSGRVDLVQDVGKWMLRLQGDAAYKQSEYELGEGANLEQQDYAATFTAKREGLIRDDSLTVVGWVRHYRMFFTPDIAVPPAPISFASTSSEARLTYALPTFAGNAMSVGALTRFSANQSAIFRQSGLNLLQVGVFAEDTYRPIKQLVITAGLRFDTREDFVSKAFSYASLSPRASIVWLINDNHSLRLEYGSAFRTPAAFERASQWPGGDGSLFVVGDERIKNESASSWSLGWLGKIGWFSARAEAFLTYTANNISPDFIAIDDSATTDSTGRPIYAPPRGRYKYPFYFHNLDHFWFPGAVVRLDFAPAPYFRAFINYTLWPEDVWHIAGAGAEFNWRGFSATTQVYVQGPVEDMSKTCSATWPVV
jgi:outer membrane receptor protein involved in Fe transport